MLEIDSNGYFPPNEVSLTEAKWVYVKYFTQSQYTGVLLRIRNSRLVYFLIFVVVHRCIVSNKIRGIPISLNVKKSPKFSFNS